MVEKEEDRYHSMKSHHPNIPFMVWDYYENGVAAYCDTEEKADRVATALNDTTNVKWSEAERKWLD